MTEPEPPSRTAALARQLLLLGALERRVKDAKTIVAQALRRSGGFDPGVTIRPSLSDADDRRAGSVSHSAPKAAAAVVDEAAFAGWVQKHYPANVELVVHVRPAFTAGILASADVHGQPVGPGGEVEIPGLAMQSKAPTISARPDHKMSDELWAEIRSDPDGLLALPADPADPIPAAGSDR